MNNTDTAASIKAHPAPGWISMVPVPAGTIKQTISDEQVMNFREQLDEHPLANLLIGGLDSGSRDQLTEHIRKHLESQACSFCYAILVEIGQVPPGYEMKAEPGDLIYYHEGKGVQIGDYTFMMLDGVIAWSEGER